MEDTDQSGVFEVFAEYGTYLVKESETREELRNAVKEIEQAGREIHTILQKIHRPGGIKDLQKIAELAESKFGKVKTLCAALDAKIPTDSYWRYSQIWSNSNSWISFLASLTLYIQTDKLPTKDQVSTLLGLDIGLVSLHLDIEEYLLGLCNLCNELSRLAVNSVTSEDYSRPVRIAEFLNSLHTGFRLLNLKNDNLRKRFDSIKYDLKKVEEVVYDLSIRGLSKVAIKDDAAAPVAAVATEGDVPAAVV
jgi:predicted translin family RNA/ssDNA-binding protein